MFRQRHRETSQGKSVQAWISAPLFLRRVLAVFGDVVGTWLIPNKVKHNIGFVGMKNWSYGERAHDPKIFTDLGGAHQLSGVDCLWRADLGESKSFSVSNEDGDDGVAATHFGTFLRLPLLTLDLFFDRRPKRAVFWSRAERFLCIVWKFHREVSPISSSRVGRWQRAPGGRPGSPPLSKSVSITVTCHARLLVELRGNCNAFPLTSCRFLRADETHCYIKLPGPSHVWVPGREGLTTHNSNQFAQKKTLPLCESRRRRLLSNRNQITG